MEEGDAAAEEIPQGENVVVVRLGGGPKGILAGLVGRNDVHVVEGSVKQLEIGSIGGVSGGDFGKHFGVPGIFRGGLQAFESGSGWDLRVDVCTGLVGRDEGHAHPRGDVGRVEGVDDSEARGGGHIVAGWELY